ncbi:right-handed parallel beta-helix repeat-containing protein [Halobaculum halobium]|uniref:Right-handed parallel beta-helix repeat-containing protein n=1 Tax=Halobaculum halobium TaxID=3032281 RepID=A0ABD5TBI4_9EURY|nr:right-handed parallel beta-helix repeat-containing protein [Halobaculum sp. SYNS20]
MTREPRERRSVSGRDRPRRLSRRGALRASTLAAGGIALARLGAGRAAAQTTVTGGGDALQEAIDAADEGDTVVVADDATYDPVTIDVADLAVEADGDPTVEGAGGTGAAVTVEADGVTLSGITVTNPGGLLGIKVEAGFDDAAIVNNVIEDVGPTGRLGVTGIVVGQGDHDGIEIANNEIRDLDQETTDDSGFPTANGILFDADNSKPGTISDCSVVNNTIEGIESDVAPLGIVVQHATAGLSIVNNEVRDLVAADDTDSDQSDSVDFGFTFAQGLNVASPSTADTVVARNTFEDITSAETILPEAVKIDGDGGGVRFHANVFAVAIGVNNRNGDDDGSRDPSGDPTVDARNNYWGSREGPEEADFNQAADDDDRADVVGRVAYEPYLRNGPGGRGGGDNGGNGQGGGNGRGG